MKSVVRLAAQRRLHSMGPLRDDETTNCQDPQISVTRFGETISHFGKNSKVFWLFVEGLFRIFGKISNLLWQNVFAEGQFLLLKMAKYWANNLAIWSHCSPCSHRLSHSFSHSLHVHLIFPSLSLALPKHILFRNINWLALKARHIHQFVEQPEIRNGSHFVHCLQHLKTHFVRWSFDWQFFSPNETDANYYYSFIFLYLISRGLSITVRR